jgi:hypothetical protein
VTNQPTKAKRARSRRKVQCTLTSIPESRPILLDRGYLVYVEEDRPGSVPRRTLYPLDALDALTYPAEATPQKGYTAEEVARAYPELTHEVGLPLERDIDFE